MQLNLVLNEPAVSNLDRLILEFIKDTVNAENLSEAEKLEFIKSLFK